MRNFDKEYSLVRFLHAVPNGDAVDIFVNGSSFYKDLDFTKFTPYVYMPKGTYTIEIFQENAADNSLAKQSIDVKPGELVTVAIIVNNGKVELLPIKEDMEIASGRDSKTRFVHLVPNGRNVNIILDNKVIATDLKYTNVTPYEILPPEEYKIDIEAVDSKQIIRSIRVNINPNRIYTFYALGEAPNFEILQSLDGAVFLI